MVDEVTTTVSPPFIPRPSPADTSDTDTREVWELRSVHKVIDTRLPSSPHSLVLSPDDPEGPERWDKSKTKRKTVCNYVHNDELFLCLYGAPIDCRLLQEECKEWWRTSPDEDILLYLSPSGGTGLHLGSPSVRHRHETNLSLLGHVLVTRGVEAVGKPRWISPQLKECVRRSLRGERGSTTSG